MRYLILGKNGTLGHDLEKVFAKEDFIAYDRSDLDITDREKVLEVFLRDNFRLMKIQKRHLVFHLVVCTKRRLWKNHKLCRH